MAKPNTPLCRWQTERAIEALDTAVITTARAFGVDAVQGALITHATNAALLSPDHRAGTIALLELALATLRAPDAAVIAGAGGRIGTA